MTDSELKEKTDRLAFLIERSKKLETITRGNKRAAIQLAACYDEISALQIAIEDLQAAEEIK